MLCDYTGGPASNLGIVAKMAMCYLEMVSYKSIVIHHEIRRRRLMLKVVSNRLPDKRLTISGDYYVH